MSRSRLLTSLAGAALGVIALSACSTESLTERAIGYGLEQAAEGDQNIDIDLSDNGLGGFSVSTDEGEFSVNIDAENGQITYGGTEGSGTINFDTDSAAGASGGAFGALAGGQDGNDSAERAGVSFDSEDTSAVLGTTTIPEGWPAAVGTPSTSSADSNFFSTFKTADESSMTGVFEHSPDEKFAQRAHEGLLSSGWTVSFENNEGGNFFAQYEKGEMAAIITSDGHGYTNVTIVEGS